MPAEDLDDDYVANLLKQDAKASSVKYTAARLRSATARPSSQAPKPNTRFLRNILRETDSHNAALLAKEAEESRARLRELQKEKDVGHRSSGEPADHEDTRSRKRTHPDDEKREHQKSGPHEDGDRHGRQSRRRTKEKGRREVDRNSRRKRHHGSDDENDQKSSPRHRRSRRYRSRSPNPIDRPQSRSRTFKHSYKGSHRRKSEGRDRSRSSLSKRSKRHDKRRSHRSRSRSKSPLAQSSSRARPTNRHKSSPLDSDSDPLESIVGPLPLPEPTIRSKGRGAHKNSSAMDAHFSKDYDPSADVHLNSDMEDEWGQALEAVRDRQRWHQQRADRLRSAGFTEHEIRKWEKGGEKNEDDVRWAKRGEGREWDRGKVVHDSGEITLSAGWGRVEGS